MKYTAALGMDMKKNNNPGDNDHARTSENGENDTDGSTLLSERSKTTIYIGIFALLLVLAAGVYYAAYLQERVIDTGREECPYGEVCSYAEDLAREGEFIGRIISVGDELLSLERITQGGNITANGEVQTVAFDDETVIGLIAPGMHRDGGKQVDFMSGAPELLRVDAVVYIEFDEQGEKRASHIFILI